MSPLMAGRNHTKQHLILKNFQENSFLHLSGPKFLAIISAHVLATYLAKDEVTRPDGFIIEGFTAGGHNAPPSWNSHSR